MEWANPLRVEPAYRLVLFKAGVDVGDGPSTVWVLAPVGHFGGGAPYNPGLWWVFGGGCQIRLRHMGQSSHRERGAVSCWRLYRWSHQRSPAPPPRFDMLPAHDAIRWPLVSVKLKPARIPVQMLRRVRCVAVVDGVAEIYLQGPGPGGRVQDTVRERRGLSKRGEGKGCAQ